VGARGAAGGGGGGGGGGGAGGGWTRGGGLHASENQREDVVRAVVRR
jgi:hypothetical protein